jgi:hypothetical protein
MRIVDTTNAEAADELAERYMNAGRERLFSAKAARRKLKNPLNYAMMLEDLGDVGCTFCGHTNTTGDVLIAAQMIIGLADGVDVPSILTLVQTPGFSGPEGDVIALGAAGIALESIDAFSGYCGGMGPTVGGIFRIDTTVCEHVLNCGMNHPAFLGAPILFDLASRCGKPAFAVNQPDTDELEDVARITGRWRARPAVQCTRSTALRTL